jgi:hypothetical protein
MALSAMSNGQASERIEWSGLGKSDGRAKRVNQVSQVDRSSTKAMESQLKAY